MTAAGWAGASRRLRAALVTPVTGPLAEFGCAGATALTLWAEAAGASLAVHDAHPDPLRALGVAEAARPDVLFGPYGTSPTIAVTGATHRLVWNHGGAQVPASPTVVSVLAPAATYWHGALHALVAADPVLTSVAVLHSVTSFGTAVGSGAARCAESLGLRVVRRALPVASADLDVRAADAVLMAGGFEAERRAAAALLPGSWRAVGFVGAGVDEVLADLGAAREGLLGPAQWLAAAAPRRPDEGPSCAEFVAMYRRRSNGAEPAYPAAQAFAAGLLAARCVRDAGSTTDADVRLAAAALDCTTLFDRFCLDPHSGEQVGHRVLTVQWQDGRRRSVWPPDRAEASVRLDDGLVGRSGE